MYLEGDGPGTPGYAIPYYDMQGNRVAFYRVKLFKPLPKGAKYLQPQNSPAWVYFPQKFPEVLKATLAGKSRSVINGFEPFLILCEGEKKSAKAVREGFLCAGLGGIYSWRTRLIELPEGTSLFKKPDGSLMAKLTGNLKNPSTSDRRAVLANGFLDCIALACQQNLTIVIAFDSDYPPNLKVQQAAAELAFELRTRGVPMNRIRQLVLPANGSKLGLDDFLVQYGPDALTKVLHPVLSARSAFPRHPDLKAFINSRMEGNMTRNEAKELGMTLLADMDIDGMRMIETSTRTPYFFDGRSKALLRVNLLHHNQEPLHETPFGEYLYRQYDMSQGDTKLLTWLAAGFTGEQPVQDVAPRSVLALMPNNRIAIQLDDGHFAIVSGDPKLPFKVVQNGTEGLLFRADQVDPIDHSALTVLFHQELKRLRQGTFDFNKLYWPAALSQFKYCRPNDQAVMSILFYMSPWLWRWNATQLPVELMIGEPGSGKSSMYTLRQLVLTGRPALRNQPADIRDWYSSITSNDGMHVTDNLHFASKEMRQRLSDEICRIVTEPEPYVEVRKLFTTMEQMRVPVRTCFAVTAIQQPFMNADILQRSIVVELQAVGTDHSADWPREYLEKFGGRNAWMAQQLAVLHLFFERAEKEWDPSYKSHHRLANFEQMFKLMAKVLRLEGSEEIIHNLANIAEEQVSEYDWSMEGLKDYCAEYLPVLQQNPRRYVTLDEVATWAMGREEYMDNTIITNARKLSRYIKSHAFMVESCTGLFPVMEANGQHMKYANKHVYRIKLLKH
jgi:hypothetical protein